MPAFNGSKHAAHVEQVFFTDADLHHELFLDVVAVTETINLPWNLLEQISSTIS